MSSAPQFGKKTGSPAVLALVLVSLLMLGVVAAVAVPKFRTFGARSKQTECKASLRALYVAQEAYRMDAEAYSTSLLALGFRPEPGNRYAYFAAAEGALLDRATAPDIDGTHTGVAVDPRFRSVSSAQVSDVLPFVRPGLEGTCPACAATMACAGNIDLDPRLDVWSVSTRERALPSGEVIPAGEPFLHQDDTGG